MIPHSPEYVYCPDPDNCCQKWGPVSIRCGQDLQRWPCETKRSHHSDAENERTRRWVDRRLGIRGPA